MDLKSFFYLNRSDRRAMLFIAALLLVCIALSILVGNNFTETATSDSLSLHRQDNFGTTQSAKVREHVGDLAQRHTEQFLFDPNTADSATFAKLGLSPFQIQNIYKYRAKGGVYRAPEDFARVYGMTRKQYTELAPFIRISDDYLPATTLTSVEAYMERRQERARQAHEAYEKFKASDAYKPYKEYDRDTIRYPLKLKVGQHINLATADTTLLKKVPGIGSGWARAIVAYGERLGGFVSVGQLKEIEDFPLESLPYFEVHQARTTKLNLNTLTLNQLRKHPYINFYQARTICDYRRLKGKITSLSQLRLLKDFPPEALERLAPYVTF